MSEGKPLILIVNDDGYEAKGLEAMVTIAKPLGEVAVVVPDRTRSGMGHAITMGEPLRLTNYKNEDGVAYYKTNGTPVDCVKLGEKIVLRNRKIDLVSVGLSVQDYSPNADFTAAIHYGSQIVKQVLEKGLPPYICLNVNFPKASLEEIKGIRVTRQCHATWHEDLQERTDPYGRNYYWLTGWLERLEEDETTCEGALQRNYVSVQPVQFDLTAHQYISTLKFLES